MDPGEENSPAAPQGLEPETLRTQVQHSASEISLLPSTMSADGSRQGEEVKQHATKTSTQSSTSNHVGTGNFHQQPQTLISRPKLTYQKHSLINRHTQTAAPCGNIKQTNLERKKQTGSIKFKLRFSFLPVGARRLSLIHISEPTRR